MRRKEVINKWHNYFGESLRRGSSWNKIRYDLIQKYKYKASLIETLIYNYKVEKTRRQKIIVGAAASLLLIFLVLPFFIKPTILGMILGGGTNTDYIGLGNGINIVFVDKNNPNCNNAYTRAQALNGLTPWCSLEAPLTKDKLLSGDTLYIGAGEYNGESDITNWDITANITISAYPGDQVNLTRYITGLSSWTNVGNGVWYANSNGSTGSSYYRVYLSNMSKFFTYGTYDAFINCPYPRCSWTDTTSNPDKIMIKFNDTSIDPNSLNIKAVTGYRPLYINNNDVADDSWIIIKNLNFHYIIYGVEVRATSNVIIDNCNFYGGHNPVYINGRDVANIKNIVVRNSRFNGSNEFYWVITDIKAHSEETDAILIQDFYGRAEIFNNTFRRYGGAVSTATNSYNELNGSEISYNTMYEGAGSQMEIENFCYNSTWHHNKVYDCYYAGVSWAPANAQLSPVPCNFSYNVIACPYSHRETAITNQTAYAIKAQSRVTGANNVTNWIIDHNTFYGKTRAINTMEFGTGGTQDDCWNNITWTNNIFYADKTYTIMEKGLAVNGVFFDYNLYYGSPEITALFGRWNNNVAGNYYRTLATALSSSDWDGRWDIHSAEGNPLFTAEFTDLTPREGSPTCTMSSTGSYVGALPCAGSSPLATFCGDSNCDDNENCSTCAADCGSCLVIPFCGDSTCNNNENCSTCSNDCGTCPIIPVCGDGTCNGDENCSTCASDCGNCPIVPYCGDSNCNDNENCSTCSNDCGNCTLAPVCGDNSCNGAENCSTCNADCGNCSVAPYCGDGACNNNESCSICNTDCGTCPEIQTPSRGGGGGSSRSTTNNNITNTSNVRQGETKTSTKEGTIKVKQEIGEEKTEGQVVEEPNQEVPGGIALFSSDQENSSLLIFAATLLAITIIGIIMVLNKPYQKPKKLSIDREKDVKEAQKPQGLNISDSENNIEDLAKLHKYAREAAKRGYTRERAENELLAVGWEKGLVHNFIIMHDSEFLGGKVAEFKLSQSQNVVSDSFIQNEGTLQMNEYDRVKNAQTQPKRISSSMKRWMEYERIDFNEPENEEIGKTSY
jgi:hypothetical protein